MVKGELVAQYKAFEARQYAPPLVPRVYHVAATRLPRVLPRVLLRVVV
jgi:hypothetical protein